MLPFDTFIGLFPHFSCLSMLRLSVEQRDIIVAELDNQQTVEVMCW